MIIVGIQGCTDCLRYYSLHPEYKYVEIRKNPNEKVSPQIMLIAKALTKMPNFDRHYPVLISDDLTKIVMRDKLIQEMKSKLKTGHSGCTHCGGKRS